MSLFYTMHYGVCIKMHLLIRQNIDHVLLSSVGHWKSFKQHGNNYRTKFTYTNRPTLATIITRRRVYTQRRYDTSGAIWCNWSRAVVVSYLLWCILTLVHIMWPPVNRITRNVSLASALNCVKHTLLFVKFLNAHLAARQQWQSGTRIRRSHAKH